MKQFFRWKGFVILFMITAAIALMSFYSCKKGNQGHTDPFAEPKKTNVTLRELSDTSIHTGDTQVLDNLTEQR
ncbi:MAG: hypothetical protein EOP56_10530 [Sphingobacteriales bacterium]|nr:MAG: hypothetical protein EOP56_10530 [Sphingobacteriales bacterium]